MGRNFLIFMAGLGLFGAMAGRFQAPASTPASFDQYARPHGSSAATPAVRSSDSESGDAVVLERSGDGHFYADVALNGATVRMLVDTGASGVALSRDDARSAGIATSIGMPNVVGEGADGAVHGEVVTIDRMALGNASASGVQAVVLNAGAMSLLGQDFLRQFKSVEIRDDRMVMR